MSRRPGRRAACARLGDAPLGRAVTASLQELTATLRALGVRVGVGELLAAHRALAAVDAGAREQAFHALRATLCSSRADHEPFALAFTAVFGAEHDEADAARAALGSIPGAVLPRVAVPALAEDRDLPALLEPVPAAWSDEELLRDKDFAEYSDAERAAAPRLLARLAARGPTRVSRRTRPVRRRGHIPDLRATTRASLRQGGELLERRWRAPDPAPAPARARARRVGLDGAVRAPAAPVPAGERRRAHARRGVRVRHAAHADHARARRPRSGCARCGAPPSA